MRGIQQSWSEYSRSWSWNCRNIWIVTYVHIRIQVQYPLPMLKNPTYWYPGISIGPHKSSDNFNVFLHSLLPHMGYRCAGTIHNHHIDNQYSSIVCIEFLYNIDNNDPLFLIIMLLESVHHVKYEIQCIRIYINYQFMGGGVWMQRRIRPIGTSK